MRLNGNVYSLLKRLGLNQYESKVYAGLLASGISTAGDISDVSAVPRSRVYDVLASLEKKGFVVVQQDRPVKYLPIEPNEVLKRVEAKYRKEFNNKIAELKKLEKNIVETLTPLYETSFSNIDPALLSSFVRGSENVKRQIERMILSADKSVCKITTGNGLIRLNKYHSYNLQTAKKKGTEIRLLADIEKKHIPHAAEVGKHAKVRHVEGIRGRFLIKDGKEALLIISPESSQQDFGILVKSEYLAKSMQQLFDHFWEHGQEVN